MTTFYSLETANAGLTPPKRISDVAQRGRVKVIRNTITLASQQIADNVYLGKRPAGSRFLKVELTTDTSLSTSTVAIGTLASTGKYKAAAAFTTTNTPTPFGLPSAQDDPALSADEDIYLTVAALALPSSGTLVVDIYYVES
jgi:hypothetical protein